MITSNTDILRRPRNDAVEGRLAERDSTCALQTLLALLLLFQQLHLASLVAAANNFPRFDQYLQFEKKLMCQRIFSLIEQIPSGSNSLTSLR